MYRKSGESWATREIAALDFLLNIPLEAERQIVLNGLDADHDHQQQQRQQQYHADLNDISYDEEELRPNTVGDIDENERQRKQRAHNNRQQQQHQQKQQLQRNINLHHAAGSGWWDSIIAKDSRIEDERIKKRKQLELETGVLERPDEEIDNGNSTTSATTTAATSSPSRTNATTASLDVNATGANAASRPMAHFIPGRRLDGHEATRINVPREAAETELKTTFRTVARRAAEKEWEVRTMQKTGLLDGRIFFSHSSSYPIGVFSVIRYDPKNEEEKKRRQKLEALGGGGSQFILPSRDWRGISYRMLFPRKERKNKAFNQMLEKIKRKSSARYERLMKLRGKGVDVLSGKKLRNGDVGDRDSGDEEDMEHSKRFLQSLLDDVDESIDDDYFGNNVVIDIGDDSQIGDIGEIEVKHNHGDEDSENVSSSSSEESMIYEPGFLDDPEMKKGKHRTAMVGDKVTGCVVSSIIHYVSPADLKTDLNRQFRQRFDQWEPPKARRKYIGARVVDGTYKLIDPDETNLDDERNDGTDRDSDDERLRKGSIAELENIRMPPSLTLSKIRGVKRAALEACVRAKLEVSTVALACVYFERLALDCRVDKSNRRLTFAACLLLAIKTNESNVQIVHERPEKVATKGSLKSLIKPRKEKEFFASLFVFFTHEWQLSLKDIFAAEWGVFAALEFRLEVEPSQVTFHFKRLMKALEMSPLDYLGPEMYDQWQDALTSEAERKSERAERKEKRRRQREKKILKLQRELQDKETVEFVSQRRSSAPMTSSAMDQYKGQTKVISKTSSSEIASVTSPPKTQHKRKGIFSRMGLKRSSHDSLQPNVTIHTLEKNTKLNAQFPTIHRSLSSPILREGSE